MDEQTIFNRIVDIAAAEFPLTAEPITRNDRRGRRRLGQHRSRRTDGDREAFGIRFSPVEIVSFEEVGEGRALRRGKWPQPAAAPYLLIARVSRDRDSRLTNVEVA